MKKLLFLMSLGLIFNFTLLQAQDIINPVSATTTLTAQFGTTLDLSIDGTGLDAFPSLTANHGMSVFGNSFVAINETGSIDFNLGGSYLVDGLAFWNQNFFGPVPGENGIQEVLISSSNDGVTYTPIVGAPNIFAQTTCMNCPSEQFSFTEVMASFIRFDVINNWGEPTYVGFSEVAFSGIEAIVIENVIIPVSASSTLAPAGTDINNAINGTGLATFPSLSANHVPSNPINSWISQDATGTIDFDLGGAFLVDGFSFWNQNAGGPGADGTTGIRDVVIYSSEDGVTFTEVPGAINTFAQVTTGDSPPEQFAFAEVTASFMRIEVLNNHGDMFTGFAEIAFSGIEAPAVENVINPVSATTTLSAQFGSNLINTINGSGLDAFPSLSATHAGTDPGSAFWATLETGNIDFDLGGAYLVDGLAFWNANTNGPPQTGIQDVIVYSSEDGVTYTAITGAPTVFAEAIESTSPAQQFSFAEVTASFIRFEVTTNYGSPNLIAFAEVAFSGVATLGVNDNVLEQFVSVYPNPALDVVTISNGTDVMINTIEIYDMNGRLVNQLKVDSNSDQTINVSELTTGMYLINITSDQATVVKRLIKK
jgi:hypothetical protein